MQKGLIRNGLIFSVIVLFITVGVQPVFAENIETLIIDNIKNKITNENYESDDCCCYNTSDTLLNSSEFVIPCLILYNRFWHLIIITDTIENILWLLGFDVEQISNNVLFKFYLRRSAIMIKLAIQLDCSWIWESNNYQYYLSNF